MKPVPTDKSHCFKHACTFPLHEGECPYCKLDRMNQMLPGPKTKNAPTDDGRVG